MSFIDKLFRRSGGSRDRSRLMRYDVNQYRFVAWDKKATDLYLIRASVDALARNIAKMQLEAVMYTDRDRAEEGGPNFRCCQSAETSKPVHDTV